MLKRLAILSLLVFGQSSILRADVAMGWTRLETENFEFVGNADAESIRTVAERLERFRTALGRVMMIREAASRTRVIVFKDSAAFRGFKPLKADGMPDDRVLGLFVAGEDFNTIALAADNPDLGTVYHEYVHDVLSASFGTEQIPPWLNEGLASYFQTFLMPDEKTATFGSARPEYLALLRTTPLIPWDEFFALDNFTLHRDAVNVRPIFYAQAWALASYSLSRSSSKIEPNLMVSETYKIDRSKLNEVLTFAGSEAALRRIDIVETTPGSREMSSPVSEASANSILGDLLYRQRNSQAESYLKRAIELDPRLAAAYTSLGQLRMRERKFPEAKAFLERAVALDSQSHLAHFAFAFLLLRENLDEAAMLRPLGSDIAARIRGAVTRSIALNAKFAESHYLLATVEFSSGDVAVAETAIRKAVDLKPGNQNYSLLLAQILLRQEKTDEATKIADRLTMKPDDARIKAEAQSVLKNAGEILNAKNSANDGPEIHLAGYRKPVVVKYSDLTPEQVAKIDRDREIFNNNILIDRPATGESHTVGFIERIDCVADRIEFRIRSGTTRLNLSTKRFDDVRFRVTVQGTRSFAFRCGTRLPNDLAVIVFKPGRSPVTGELKAITFVPKDFEFRTAEELMSLTHYVVEGRPTEDISQNETISAKEREAMEREMRETQIRDIDERLRPLEATETRVIGVPEKQECAGGRINITFKVEDTLRSFSTAITKPFELQSFNPEAQLIEVGCRAQLPAVTAVITFKKADNELVSVEFVPAWFKLR
jgi:tetratricopeptide (TPR) repeat protein